MDSVLQFPEIDPAIFTIHLFGMDLALRWYALAYIAGLVLGWRYRRRALPQARSLGRDGPDGAANGPKSC